MTQLDRQDFEREKPIQRMCLGRDIKSIGSQVHPFFVGDKTSECSSGEAEVIEDDRQFSKFLILIF